MYFNTLGIILNTLKIPLYILLCVLIHFLKDFYFSMTCAKKRNQEKIQEIKKHGKNLVILEKKIPIIKFRTYKKIPKTGLFVNRWTF